MKRIRTIRLKGCDLDKRLSEEKNVSFFLEPEYVYYPLKDFVFLKKIDDYVFEGDAILKSSKFDLFVNSSVSGYVISTDELMYDKSGNLEKFIKIKNDFKNNKSYEKRINIINSKNDLIKLCKEKGIVGLGGGAFPTYLKLQSENVRDLIVNACECEPFLTCDYKLIFEKSRQIIEILNLIRTIMNYDNIFIAIKKNKINAIKLLEKEIISMNLKEYIKIKTVEDSFPVGYEKYLVNKVLNKDYKTRPVEALAIVLNIATVYSIYEAVMFNKPLIERLVTVSGYSIKNPKNVYIKIGTCFKELIKEIDGYIEEESANYLIAGGAMTGNSIKSESLVFTPGLSQVTVLSRKKNEFEFACMGCGKCNYYCPSNLNPYLIKLYFKDLDMLYDLRADKCVSCNICSYVCPSRIELSYFASKAKDKIRRGK